ncbi:adhesin-like protein [Methanobrevibacter olleyae]|uniref:Adhesin-like protein n=2 Tax=Methanobrevibacter olleyae TaxID=294671 RepID=A0A126QXW9_METOL|nr:adhesin-like protein [Methanobrevibacter olleyae]
MINDLNKIVIVFLFLIFLSISAVSAQENTSPEIGLNENMETIDAETADESVNLGTGDDSAVASESGKEDEVNNVMNEDNLKGTGSSFTDLQNLINNTPENNILTLDKDYAYSPGDSQILINKSITIDGKNHVLDGKLSTRILNITGNHVTLKNIKFINANNTNDQYGGAVAWGGNYGNMINCSFVNNHAGIGGAVYWNGDNGTLKDCSFVNNHANKYSGGAVAWAGYNGNLKDCSFVNNHAKYGGAVHWNGDNGTLKDCSFANNHAKYNGGAVAWGGDYGTLKDCSFVNNHAEYNGGAVHWNTEYGVLSLCSFTNNTANQSGNAIYLYRNTTNVSDCSFNIYRPTNTSTVTINNLIYCNETNYGVNYYENDKKINSGHINNASVTFYNLDKGKHKIQMIYNSFINNIIINGDSYLSAGNVSMFYNDGTKYTIKLADHKGNPIANQNIQITIGNLKYTIKTDIRGYATLVLKQKVGKYNIIAKFDGNSDYNPSNVVSTLRILDSPITKNKNLKMYFRGGRFKVQIINANGKHVGAGKTVKFTIAGKTYTRKTDKNGYASLRILLKPKTYYITTQYGKFIKKNKITVKPVLTAKNIVVKKAKTIKFSAKLVNTKGKPRAKKTIIFKLKGKTYKVKTNKRGKATLKIRNLKKGNYKIYTQYGKSKIKNTIKIT